MNEQLAQKYAALRANLADMQSVAVAYSAGVDSTLLIHVGHGVLGDNAVAYTAVSPANPQRETDAAAAFCQERGIRQVVFQVNELELDGFDHNPTDRCYRCKDHLFRQISSRASQAGLAFVAEGSNVDDLSDYRPGRRALEELGIKSPLLEAGLTKQEIRDLSKELGLPTWDKPSLACLYSRFSYGQLMTRGKLAQIDSAEQFLMDRGFSIVRVRVDGENARIEVDPADLEKLMRAPLRGEVVSELKRLGFAYVTADLQGYRTGSMNETLGV